MHASFGGELPSCGFVGPPGGWGVWHTSGSLLQPLPHHPVSVRPSQILPASALVLSPHEGLEVSQHPRSVRATFRGRRREDVCRSKESKEAKGGLRGAPGARLRNLTSEVQGPPSFSPKHKLAQARFAVSGKVFPPQIRCPPPTLFFPEPSNQAFTPSLSSWVNPNPL